MINSQEIRDRWDKEYLSGKYFSEKEISFVDEILSVLRKRNLISGKGLYIGCGNGRNYIPLLNAGLNLTGLDVSSVAIDQLSNQVPKDKLVCADFQSYSQENKFDYIIAIQIFQHGNQEEAKKYFSKTSMHLKERGLLFLRTNSISTQIEFKHDVVEENSFGGFTLKYLEGPKKDLLVHFYTPTEIISYASEFKLISDIEERKMLRKNGSFWAQWEAVLEKL